MKFSSFVNLFKVENLVDKHIDELEFSNKDYFSNVVTLRKELADKLINDNEVVNQGIIFINELIRSYVEIAVDLLLNLDDIVLQKGIITKGVSASDFEKFSGALDRELEIAAIHNEDRMWAIFGTSYGQGMDRGLADVGVDSSTTEWEKFRETTAYKELAIQNLRYVSDELTLRIKEVVASGVTEGNSTYDIARRLREIKLAPRLVKVPDKIVNGKVVRRGYSYTIDDKRYANMIARTESSRAVNQGRIDAYKRTGIQQVEWLSAGDERVCSDCMDLDGKKFPIDNAPLLPLHVFCRCTVVVSGKITDDQKRNAAESVKLTEADIL
jgi:SPP1 gp7 family putative phage head morphogenesis protein